VAGIVTTAAGAVGLGVGAAFGLLSLSKHSTVSELCPATSCGSLEGVDASNDARTYGDVSTVAFIVGGLGLAAGLTLWLSAPRSPESKGAAAQLVVGPGNAAVVGSW
jgi:hypothetical protein